HRAQLFGSGAIVNEAVKAGQILAEKYGVAADVWSVTSHKELRRDALDAERWNLLHPGETPRIPYITRTLQNEPGVFVAASDYVKILPDSISRWFPKPLISLGTDGFGLSESRAALRDHFEIDARYITLATLTALMREGEIEPDVVRRAVKDLNIDPEKRNPMA
ncbi:MAG: pyruvate dehydrogenase (acetyl-transferring), homodimeric type, partial [Nitrospinota bacterium]|nr:pyruvate dehydrogenase (acetyl-transferring), homodimeric type [Nitrospinota bacterium]